jgi:hypothetical protein
MWAETTQFNSKMSVSRKFIKQVYHFGPWQMVASYQLATKFRMTNPPLRIARRTGVIKGFPSLLSMTSIYSGGNLVKLISYDGKSKQID